MDNLTRIPYEGYEIVITEDVEQYTFRIFKDGQHQGSFNFAVSKTEAEAVVETQLIEGIEETFEDYIDVCKTYIDILVKG